MGQFAVKPPSLWEGWVTPRLFRHSTRRSAIPMRSRPGRFVSPFGGSRRGTRLSCSSALSDDRRLEPALKLTDESWSITVIAALTEALQHTPSAPVRGRIVANIAGLLHKYPDWDGSWFGTNPLAGAFPRKTTDWDPQAMKAVLDGLSLGLTDPDSSVRFQAITGMAEAGKEAPPRLRSALPQESDATNQAVLVETLGTLKDTVSLPLFIEILCDVKRAEAVRMAALVALSQFRDPRSLRARLSLLYAEKTPPALVARALPDLARLGFLPPNDLASFMENAAPEIRASALLSLNVKKALPADLQQSVMDHVGDPDESVRQAAILALVPLKLRAAVPRLLELAAKPDSPDYCDRCRGPLRPAQSTGDFGLSGRAREYQSAHPKAGRVGLAWHP